MTNNLSTLRPLWAQYNKTKTEIYATLLDNVAGPEFMIEFAQKMKDYSMVDNIKMNLRGVIRAKWIAQIAAILGRVDEYITLAVNTRYETTYSTVDDVL